MQKILALVLATYSTILSTFFIWKDCPITMTGLLGVQIIVEPGFLIGFFNEGRRTFHDITGKTLVVNV